MRAIPELMIQKRHPCLERVRHGSAVNLYEHISRQGTHHFIKHEPLDAIETFTLSDPARQLYILTPYSGEEPSIIQPQTPQASILIFARILGGQSKYTVGLTQRIFDAPLRDCFNERLGVGVCSPVISMTQSLTQSEDSFCYFTNAPSQQRKGIHRSGDSKYSCHAILFGHALQRGWKASGLGE